MFTEQDVVRHPLVQEIIRAYENRAPVRMSGPEDKGRIRWKLSIETKSRQGQETGTSKRLARSFPKNRGKAASGLALRTQ